jgi:hypothetical protein
MSTAWTLALLFDLAFIALVIWACVSSKDERRKAAKAKSTAATLGRTAGNVVELGVTSIISSLFG